MWWRGEQKGKFKEKQKCQQNKVHHNFTDIKDNGIENWMSLQKLVCCKDRSVNNRHLICAQIKHYQTNGVFTNSRNFRKAVAN